MPLDITFTLSDDDLEHFQEIVDRAKLAMGEGQQPEQVEAAARKMIEAAKSAELPDFIAKRLFKLETVINMVTDEEWRLSEEERNRIRGALIYFTNPEDLIPDHIPGLGYLDDAIYVELIIRELKNEIDHYEEFCLFRSNEERKQIAEGKDPHVDRELWLAEKRSALHSRMRRYRRRRMGEDSSSWRFRW
jgi:uncharacterized membrane protein YkvA (DUF1232 family)